MHNTFADFILGFLSTFALFILCLLLVVGGKMVLLSIKQKLFPKTPTAVPPAQKSPVVKARKHRPKSGPKPIRSIEIDPEQIDRIYVKKIS